MISAEGTATEPTAAPPASSQCLGTLQAAIKYAVRVRDLGGVSVCGLQGRHIPRNRQAVRQLAPWRSSSAQPFGDNAPNVHKMRLRPSLIHPTRRRGLVGWGPSEHVRRTRRSMPRRRSRDYNVSAGSLGRSILAGGGTSSLPAWRDFPTIPPTSRAFLPAPPPAG